MKLFKLIKKKINISYFRLWLIIGPGIIAGNADNDAGGITTYSVAGANFGLSLLWVLLLTTFALAITQEIGARMGLVTGKGLASLSGKNLASAGQLLSWLVFLSPTLAPFLPNLPVLPQL